MAHVDDIPEPTRSAILALDVPAAESRPFVAGPKLAERRVAIVTSAALHPRGEAPFPAGSAEFRPLPARLAMRDIVMSHVSINFDRAGWSRDGNVAYPIDRLRELTPAAPAPPGTALVPWQPVSAPRRPAVGERGLAQQIGKALATSLTEKLIERSALALVAALL